MSSSHLWDCSRKCAKISCGTDPIDVQKSFVGLIPVTHISPYVSNAPLRDNYLRTVRAFNIHHEGTVPPFKMHPGGTVPTIKMDSGGWGLLKYSAKKKIIYQNELVE